MGDGREKGKAESLLDGDKVDIPKNEILQSEATKAAFGPRDQQRIDDELRRKAGVYDHHREDTAFDKWLAENRGARIALVTAEGLAMAVPGAITAVFHDAANPVGTLEKAGTALTLGVGLRTVLPEKGAARAVTAGLFTYYMIKDAAVPVAQSYSEVWDPGKNHADVFRSATKMGGGVGQLGWDFWLGGKIAMQGERLAAAGMKRYMGETRFNAFEQAKSEWYKSDKNMVGRNVNRVANAIDRTTGSLAEALLNKPKAEKPVTLEEAFARIKAAEHEYVGKHDLITLHKVGAKATDGKKVGYSESMDMWHVAGKDPRKMSSQEIAAESKALATETYLMSKTESGLLAVERPLLLVEGGEVKVIKNGREVAAGNGTLRTKVQEEINANNINDFSRMAKDEMAKLSEQQQQIFDHSERPVGVMNAAMNKDHSPLDPGYAQIKQQVNGLHEALINPPDGKGPKLEDFQQLAPLTSRLTDAAIGHLNLEATPTGRNVGSMNRMSWELYTGYARKIAQLGMNPNEVLAAKNPPLNLIAYDGGSGPHTIPQIDGIWNIDLVHWPRNMQNLKILRAGIQGHENIHDQYGGILRFADSIREQVIGESVAKALGGKAQQMVDVPGHGQMSMKDLVVHILKAQANENTADMGGAAWTGTNGALSLGVLLQSLRTGGKLETRNVYGKEYASPENPLGFEVHGMDAWRIKLVAEVVRQRSGGDKHLLEQAAALDKYADEASRPGDYSWANMDAPGQKITISRKDFEAIIPELVKAQFNTPLAALKGKTYGDIVPDLPTQMRKMDQLAEMMSDAALNKKALDTIPFNVNDYTMIQLLGAGLPAALKLKARGMSTLEANAQVNRISDFLEAKLHERDPHIDPLTSTPTIGKLITSPKLAASALSDGAGRTVNNVRKFGPWLDQNAHKTIGYAGMHHGRDWFQSDYSNWMHDALFMTSGNKTSGSDKPGADQPGSDRPGTEEPGQGGDKPGANSGDGDKPKPVIGPDGKPVTGDSGAVTIPLDGDGPAGEAGRPRKIQKPNDPFLSPRRYNSIDVDELLRMQKTQEQIKK